VRSPQLDWNAIQDEANRLGIDRIVNLNLLLARKLLGAPPPKYPKPNCHSERSEESAQVNCHSERSEESAVAENYKNAHSRHDHAQFSSGEDRSTIDLANEILRVIERSTHYDTESLPYFRLMMRLRERRHDRARFLWRLALTPSVSEWSTVQFPKPLQPLYRMVRLSRLAKRVASTIWCAESEIRFGKLNGFGRAKRTKE